MTLNECNLASSTLLHHFAIESLAASLIEFFENIIRKEWHRPYACLTSGLSQLVLMLSLFVVPSNCFKI